ncbi:hypothetical protein OS493_034425 [Desmophyllum pertusum]|uniref:CCHC-type domain-containing protein n=1 Tax=Desmophyllum pertusum TaxID=174260 RepID=A0A9W9ZKD0_9CNID|nr:hypothetical protein OS493_034425 [Desmophyllum pertusum]
MPSVLSARKQGSSEPLDKYIEDLQNKFDCLELTEEEKVWFFTQGLRPDTQREVLVRQPRTFREAENAARLTQTVQQSLHDAKGNDALTRMQQQLDALTSSLVVKEKPKEPPVSAYQYSPQTPADDKLLRLERDMNQMMTVVNHLTPATGHELNRMERLEKNVERLVSRLEPQPQEMTTIPQSPLDNKVAAYQPVVAQTPEVAELSSLKQQVRQLSSMISGPQSLAAYQSNAPSGSNYNRDNKDNEVARLKEEIHQLKATVQGLQSTRGGQTDSYARNNTPQEPNSDLSYALEEIRRMQSRMDGFMRTHASRNSRQDQRVQTREYRPICDICGKAGHVRQHCFHRFQQIPNHWQPQTDQNNREIVEDLPRVAAYDHVQEAPSRNQPSYDQTNLARRSRPIPSSSTTASTVVPTINTIDAVAINSPTKIEDIKEIDPRAISKRHTRDAPIRAHRATEQRKQEIVVRIEICTANTTSESKNVTLMPHVTEENLGKEKSKLPVSATVKRNKEPAAKQREDTARIKCSLQPAGTAVPLQKQPHRETDQPSTKLLQARLFLSTKSRHVTPL